VAGRHRQRADLLYAVILKITGGDPQVYARMKARHTNVQ
jgi:hypothetical protein